MKDKLFFTLCLTLLAVVFLRHSIELGAVARMVPLAVLFPTGCLLLVQLVLDLRTGTSRVDSTRRSYSVIRYERYSQQSESDSIQRRQELDQARSVREFQVLVLLAGLLLATYLLGAVGGGCLFLALYLRYIARSDWLAVIGSTVAVAVFCSIFVQLLEVNLPSAQLFVWL
jgi:hypothetical protein